MVKDIKKLLLDLKHSGVKLWVEEGRLRSRAPEGAISSDMRNRIRLHLNDIVTLLQSAQERTSQTPIQSIPKAPEQASYALSNAQRRLWVLDQLEENQVAYNMPSAIRLEGKLDKSALQTAFSILLNRHESLRTVFVSIEGTPRQIISDADTIAVVFTDWQLKNDRKKLRDYISAHAGRPFDLTSGPLIKIEVVCLTSEEHVMLFNMHHIISDGWSMEILVRELGILYEAYTNGEANPLAPLRIQYKDYAAWQNNLLRDNTKMEGLRDYWYNKLVPAEGDIATLDLPADYPRPPVKTYRGASISKTFAAELLGKLEALGKTRGATLFMTLTALVKVLLYRYSGQGDILIGSPSAGRTHADLQDQIGFYVNTLVLRDEIKGNVAFNNFLAQVKQTCLEAFEHELYPFDRLVEELDLARDLSRSPLFDVMLVLQNNEQSDLTLGDLALSTEPIIWAVSKFDLLFNFTTSVNGLGLDVEYNTDLNKADRMERLFTHLECLIESAIENPTQTVDELKILPQAERQLILHEFNDTKAIFPVEKTIIALFEEQVEKTPDEIAIVFENKKISYRQLNEKANRMGHSLRANYGIKEDDIVGLLPQRTEWMLMGILGILKSGAAYLPLSEELPARRLEYMLRDSGAKLLLADEHHRKLGQQIFSEVVVLEELNALQKDNPKTITSPEHLAYVLYTSGSTGQPKGVEMPHQPLVNLVSWHIDNSSCGVGSRTIQSTTFSFDVSFQEIFVTWLSGGTLVMVGKTVRKDLPALAQLISREKIERVFLPFAALQELAQILLNQEEDLSALQVIITAGEQLQISEAIVELFKKIPACTLKNHYGPTEAHVVSEYILKGDPSSWMSLPPIGKPIANAELYILDDNLQPVPIGVPGSLYIGGVCLAKGYLKRADLTGERFLAHPLREGERLYKTGDLGRWLPDGNIEFLGRKDHQLKIRGYRVELGEVEHQLLQHPAISACVVLGKKIEGVTELVAYLTAKDDNVLDTGVIRSFTKEYLPDYMIPTYFVELESFPLTNSGKVNRKALPEPQGSSLSSGVDYVAPRNQLEQTLVNIWESVLKREDIGINDNFFDLGGHSLRAIRTVSSIQQQLSAELKLRDVFAHPTIADLASIISNKKSIEFKAIEPVAIQSDYALSNAQRRLWVLDQLEENQLAYSMPISIRLKGKLDKEALQSAFKCFVNRHESLRTTFVSIDGTPRQIVNGTNNFAIKFTDWDQDNNPKKLAAYILSHAQRPFNLAKGPLVKVEAICLNEEEHIMLFNMHHIISDGWSMEILVREFGILYNAFAKGEANPLTPLRIQYKDYAAWQNDLLRNDVKMEELRGYWHNKLMLSKESIPVLEIQTDFPRPAIKTYRGACINKTFAAELLGKIETLGESCDATLFMTLTALVKILLYRYSGQRDILIGSPSAGRTHADLQNQIGFFVNTLVLRDEIKEGTVFNKFLEQIKQTCLEAFEHELYPFDQLVEELDLDRDLSRSPLFDVMVVLQNNEQANLTLGDLTISDQPTSWAVSKFDLTFNFSTSSDGLTLDLEYNTDFYKADRMERLLTHFECLIESVFANQKQDVAELNILPETERQLILHDFNATHADFPSDKTIIDLFEEQVEKTPDNIAVVFEGKELTYRQLNEKANQLGHYLLEQHHIQPDDIIALQLERSEWMIIAILGAMKAGGAYLPIAPDFPKNRVAYILEDSTAKLLLTDNHTYKRGKTHEKSLPVIEVEDVSHAKYFNPVIFTHSRNLAYVIYTSGSTGQPKGVMVEHKGVNNLIGNLDKNVFRQYGAIQKMGLVASYTFDASIQLLFGSILYGHSLFIIPEKLKIDGQLFSAFLQDNQIDIIDCTPSLLAVLLEGGWQKAKEIWVKHLLIGGEVVPIKLLHDFYRDSRHHHIKMSNVYGPTETTVEVSLFNIDKSILGTKDSVPIGKPMSNCTMYILEKGQKLSPVGIPGELHIGGVGLTRGYLNNKNLTEEKFIPHPFVEGERLYKTGDLARWLPDGNIEFLGRIDHQLKIRGYRIEAGEIEQVLLQHSDIQSCVVIGKELKGNLELVAYLVRKTETVPDVLSLRRFLSESLPDYMIPAHFVELETLPLTSSGKVDRKSLPEPEGLGIATGVAYAAPQTQMEILLTEVWKEVLRQPSISIHDNFFHIGGDSIKAIQISGRLGSRGWTLSIRDLFAHPNIAELAQKITTKKEEYPQGLQRGKVPLTAIQSWFFAQELPHPHHFNQAVSLSSEERLDVVVVEKSLQGLLGHHDLLRARYESSAGVVIQNVSDTLVLDFKVIAINNADEEAEEITRVSTAAQAGFELEKGPLIKAVLFQKEKGDELLLVIHHLVVDGVSWRILIEDLTEAYRQLMSGKTIQLSPKTAPFSWWAEKIIAFSNGTLANAQYEYWKGVLSQAVCTIKADHPQQANKFRDSRSVQFRLNKENTEALFQQSNQAYHTEINDVLLTALSRALKQTFGGDAYRITLEGHGREAIFAMDISRTVGWFTSMFPVVLNYEASTGYHLQSIKENLHRIPDKGVVYGLLRYLSEDKYILLENSGISFNYLGTFAQGDTDSFFRFSESNIGPGISPDNNRPYELDVSGMLIGEELQLSVAYGSQRIDEARMEALITALENALLEIIGHCTAQEESQLTPCDFTACDLSLEAYHDFISANDLDPSKIEDIYPLSPMQEGMLFHKLLDPDSVAYFVQMDIGLSGEIDENLFRDCWQQVLDAHPVLRTSFYSDGLNRPLQVVNKDVEIVFVTKDLSHLRPEDQGQYIKT